MHLEMTEGICLRPARPREFIITIREVMEQSGMTREEVEESTMRLDALGYITILWRYGDVMKGTVNVDPELAALLEAVNG